MISLILFCFASMLNAVMDTLFDHFTTSIFRNLNPDFWDPMVSWKHCNVIPIIQYPIDAWHLMKSGMVIIICFSIVLYTPIINIYVDFLIFGVLWNIIFNLFFNKILLF